MAASQPHVGKPRVLALVSVTGRESERCRRKGGGGDVPFCGLQSFNQYLTKMGLPFIIKNSIMIR